MRLNLRPLRKPFRLAGLVLADNLRTLLRRPRVAWGVAVLLLPALAVPIAWTVQGRGRQYPVSLLLILLVQITGALRHRWKVRRREPQDGKLAWRPRRPWEARRSVRHPLPRWFFWTVQAVCAADAMVLLAVRHPPSLGEALGVSLPEIHGSLSYLLLLLLLPTLLPFALRFTASLVRSLGLVLRQRWLRLPQLWAYVLVMEAALGLGTYYIWGKPPLSVDWLVIAPALLCFVPVPALWDRSYPAELAALSQALFWWMFLLLALEESALGDVLHAAPQGLVGIALFILFGLGLLAVLLLYLARRLEFSPVARGLETGDESLSVQTDLRGYVDVDRRAEWLQTFVERSSGGVIGLTGVRGAGKSALAAHVLGKLQPRYFVLAMTAPARSDPGLGFLLTVSRAVCHRVLDDVNQGLHGRQTEEGRARREVLRRVRNVVLPAAAGALALVLALARAPALLGVAPAAPRAAPLSPQAENFFCAGIRQNERWFAEQLLGQVEAAQAAAGAARAGARAWAAGYLVVPSGEQGFLLLLQQPGVSPADQLRALSRGMPNDVFDLYRLAGRHSGAWIPTYRKADLRVLPGFCLGSQLPLYQQVTGTVRALLFGRSPDPSQTTSLGESTWVGMALAGAFLRFDPGLALEDRELHQLGVLLRGYRHLLAGRPPLAAEGEGSSAPAPSYASLARGLAILILVLLLGDVAWQALSSLARTIVNWRSAALAREARDFLELLDYSESRESSGGLSWQFLSLSRSRSLAARELTLPALSARYVEFVDSARRFYNGKLIVAIDELDKIDDPGEIKKILTEIKGALFARGCFYLISISEDATRSFRQRLSAGRDIFESTFDEILEIPPLGVAAAGRLLASRQEGRPPERRLPGSCTFVLALFAGGIPREIVRHYRRLALDFTDLSALAPAPVARHLMAVEVDEWMARLGEVELPGSGAVKLMEQAEAARAALGPDALDGPACGRIWDQLDRCLALLDPRRQREALAPEADPGEAPAAARYHALLDDIQAVLRLMMLTFVCELACAGGASEEQERALLTAHRALAHQPALAERILRGLRRDARAAAA